MIFYKIVNGAGIVSAKGTTYDGVQLSDEQIEITAEEYNSLILAPNAIEPDETEMPPTVEQQITEIQQKQQELQSVLDELLGVQENE